MTVSRVSKSIPWATHLKPIGNDVGRVAEIDHNLVYFAGKLGQERRCQDIGNERTIT